MQASLSEYYNISFNDYADYYVDYLAVSCTLFNLVRYFAHDEKKGIDEEKKLLLKKLVDSLAVSMETTARLLARLDTDLNAENELLKDITKQYEKRG